MGKPEVTYEDIIRLQEQINGLTRLLEDLHTQEAPAFGNLTDYSATSTIVGWSSFTTKQIWYVYGNRCLQVWFNVIGTSDSVNTSFTLPYSTPAAPASANFWQGLCRGQDNSVVDIVIPYMTFSSNLLNLAYGVGAAAWTASGTKQVVGAFKLATG